MLYRLNFHFGRKNISADPECILEFGQTVMAAVDQFASLRFAGMPELQLEWRQCSVRLQSRDRSLSLATVAATPLLAARLSRV
jgi:hypothetical protein